MKETLRDEKIKDEKVCTVCVHTAWKSKPVRLFYAQDEHVYSKTICSKNVIIIILFVFCGYYRDGSTCYNVTSADWNKNTENRSYF